MYQIKKRGTRKDDERKRSELTGVIVGIITTLFWRAFLIRRKIIRGHWTLVPQGVTPYFIAKAGRIAG